MQHVHADADHDAGQAVRAGSTASSRMPATLAPSTSTSFGHLSCSRAPRRRPRRRAPSANRDAGSGGADRRFEREPGGEAERRRPRLRDGHDEEQARRKIAARRLPGAAAPSVPGGLRLRDDPEPAGIPGPGARPGLAAGRADRVVSGEAIAACVRLGPSAKAIQKRLWAAAPAASTSGEAITTKTSISTPEIAEHGLQLGGHPLERSRPARRNT